MPSTLIHSGTLVDANGERPGWVHIDDGRIVSTGDPSEQAPSADRSVDATGRYVTPGFVDIHGHGAGGAHYQDGTEEALAALAAMRQYGTTRAVASFVSTTIDRMVHSIIGARSAMDLDPGLLGVHVEGPFIAPGRKGAHDRRVLCHPDRESVDRLLDVAPGIVRQITIAPELPGAMEAISRFVAAGIPVAVGHTDCDYDAAREAFDRGASLVTHAFNAMAQIEGRFPGVLGAAVAAEHVTIEVIADGIHVHPASIALLFAAAPGRIALVTDAMAGAGASDGCYTLGSLDVDVADGRAVVAGTDTLAGSTLTPDRALRTAVHDCGIALHDAVGALTDTPARAVGEKEPALLVSGAPGDLVLFDADLSVVDVLLG
ncbi:MAG: N-acetylglucosamine-6-phosphate deacetylase [Ilumatobacter fluminis]|uniref:N-acetylglucosamine-6-phosphate deacetylase n=1 Tax=Ilumatobacter fluminis TaxID=467091 RepID=UPI0032EDB2B7